MFGRWNTVQNLWQGSENRSAILRIMTSGRLPQISLVIAAYNDWVALEGCLASVGAQRNSPEIEVLVIDDGSEMPVPAAIARQGERIDLRVIRQPHSGIAVARNRGVQEARGTVVLFTDCDCVLDPECLWQLALA
ncbi:MAG TPA: glycosyltransferase family 2 protein, partial [Candidatus Acidoferrum sp.]|nr:glycosyltransferase family 2 protein [Candidatus Acidoferrum sp.]